MPSQKGSSSCGYSASFSVHLAVPFGGHWLKNDCASHIVKKLVALKDAAGMMAASHLPDHSAPLDRSRLNFGQLSVPFSTLRPERRDSQSI
jgi:hypothetical protein